MKIITFTIASILCFGQICSGQEIKMKELKIQGFTVEYPLDWIPDTSGNIGSTFFLSSPLIGEEDTFSENINLILQPLPNPKMTLSDFVNETLTQLPFYFADYTLIKQERLKKKKKEYHDIEYSGKLNGVELHFRQFYWVQNGKSYVLTFTAQGSSYAQYQEVAAKIMESLKFN